MREVEADMLFSLNAGSAACSASSEEAAGAGASFVSGATSNVSVGVAVKSLNSLSIVIYSP